MAPLDPRELIDLWDRCAGRDPVERALALLEGRVVAPQDLPIGTRDRLILAARAEWFGPLIETTANCPACGERLELAFHAGDALGRESGGAAAVEGPAIVPVEACGTAFRLRLPTSRDLAAVAHLPPDAARRTLLERLADPPGSVPEADEATEAAATALAAADPDGEILLSSACVACGRTHDFLFDPAGELWAAVDGAARRLFLEVHALASAYGWSEAEILALPVGRRRRYLELSGA